MNVKTPTEFIKTNKLPTDTWVKELARTFFEMGWSNGVFK